MKRFDVPSTILSKHDYSKSRYLLLPVIAFVIVQLPAPAQKLYWANDDDIHRSNLDGSSLEDLVISADASMSSYQDVAVVVDLGKFYFTNPVISKIERVDLNGSNVEDWLTSADGLVAPIGLALDPSAKKMYWTDAGTLKIQRANLDGTNIEDLITNAQGLASPTHIAIDTGAGKMYWADAGTRKIQRANLDGSNIEDLFTASQTVVGIAVDMQSNRMYWTELGASSVIDIRRANLNGINSATVISGGGAVEDVALDTRNGKMYWTDRDADLVRRANLDGSNVEELFTTPDTDFPRGLTLDLTRAQIYVDFAHGGTETGELGTPFNSLAEGLDNVSFDGVLTFSQGGSTPETATITKALRIEAANGPVRLGDSGVRSARKQSFVSRTQN